MAKKLLKLANVQLATKHSIENLEELVSSKVLPHAVERDLAGRFDPEIFEALWRNGWMRPYDANGETRFDSVDLLHIARTIAYGSAGVASSYLANVLGQIALHEFADPALSQRIVSGLDTRCEFFALAMTEASAGFNLGALQSTAQETAHGFILSGKKNYITNASVAQHVVIFARDIDLSGKELGVSAFYVPAGTPGLRAEAPLNKLGLRESPTGELNFNNLHVPRAHLIGKRGQGLQILTRCLGRTKTLISGAALGMADRALDLAEQHLASRQSGGKSLLSKSTVQIPLARLKTELDSAWLLCLYAANMWDKGDLCVLEASQAKLVTADLCVKVVSEAIEWVGASGYMMDSEIAKIYRDARVFEIFEGSTHILESIISKTMYPAPKEASMRKAA